MAERKGASFNPKDASGGFEKGRVTITNARVDYFTAEKGKTAGTRYVKLFMDFVRADGGEPINVGLLIGNADEWSPNAAKTEAIPAREDGKFWNKSEIYRFMVSLASAGFPEARMGADFSVLSGLDVDVERVQTGGTHKDNEGKERPNTALLVTKIHTSAADLASGAYAKNGTSGTGTAKKVSAAPSRTVTKTTTPVTSAATGGDLRAYAQTLLVDILNANGGSYDKASIQKPAYIAITKAKRGAERNDIIAILQDQAFIDSLVEQDVIVDDGETLSVVAVAAAA